MEKLLTGKFQLEDYVILIRLGMKDMRSRDVKVGSVKKVLCSVINSIKKINSGLRRWKKICREQGCVCRKAVKCVY